MQAFCFPKHKQALLCIVIAFASVCSVADSRAEKPAAARKAGTFEVHEWGTFLSVQGSDGVTLGGMVDSEEALPPFVEARGIQTWQRSMMFQKMETPVTYFYTDRPRDVAIRIDMPRGILTHWYPPVRSFGPSPYAPPAESKAGSFIAWQPVRPGNQAIRLIPDVQPLPKVAGIPAPTLTPVNTDQTWRFARATDAAFVGIRTWNTQGQPEYHFEKFLFYRGLGTFPLPLQVTSSESTGGGLVLTLRNIQRRPLESVFAVWVDDGTLRFASLGDVAGNATREVALEAALTRRLPMNEGVRRVKEAVKTALIARGLFTKEAQAMVNTWEKSYFHSPGLRLLYVLPRPTVDEVIPIQIQPPPDKLVRVMVGRVEVLYPERERQITRAVAGLGSDEFRIREAATQELAQLGRITEPALRRVAATTTDWEVRARARSLIAKVSPTP
jgi:hypothetical protein